MGSRATPRWVTTIACLAVLLLTMGAVVALARPSLLLAPGDDVGHGVRVYAGYFFSRNVAVAAALVAALATHARPILAAVLAMTALIQTLDVVVDVVTARWALVPGLALLAIVFTVAAARLAAPSPRLRPRAQRFGGGGSGGPRDGVGAGHQSDSDGGGESAPQL